MVINFLSQLEKQVTNSLKDAGIEPRPVKSNGLWCHILIPTILILYNIKYEVGYIYKLTTIVSIGILFHSILFIIFTSISSHSYTKSLFSGTTACSFLCTLFINYYYDFGILVSFVLSWLTICSYSLLIRQTLSSFPRTFTFGEAAIVIQGIVLTTFMIITKVFTEKQYEFISCTVFLFLFSMIVIIILMQTLRSDRRNIKCLIEIVVFGAMLCLSLLHCMIGRYYFLDFIYFLTYDIVRIKIFLSWLCLLAASIVIVHMTTKKGNKADTVTRKAFHILGALVFSTGCLFDVPFMKLFSGLAFGLLLFVEALRISSIEPLSQTLQSAFIVYSDEKDMGSFAMTPIYLFVGLSCPLLLVPEHDNNKLELLSGVLAIGIGDSCASWAGKNFGTHKWTGSNRTIEGTIANIISQLCTIYILFKLNVIMMPRLLVHSVIATTITGLIEANLEQVDNLLLPLCNILVLQLTSIIF